MGLQFVIGGTGSGKTAYVMHQMAKGSRDPQAMELYIVPEQYTLHAQEEYLERTGEKGLLHVEVLSFNRLVYRFYDYLGIVNKTTMDDNSKSLIIRKIIEEHQDEFIWVKKHRKKQAYMDELNTLITECYQYTVDEAVLERYLNMIEDRMLKDKLQDLKTLLKYFKQEMAESFITTQEASVLLLNQLDRIEALCRSSITVDSFYGFTPLQYQFIERLMMVAKEVRICITIPEWDKLTDMRNESELFHESKKAVSKIRDLAEKNHIPEKEMIVMQGNRRSHNDQMRHLVDNLFSYPIKPYTGQGKHMRMMEAATLEEEVEAVAIRIHRLVKERGSRFKEVAVLCSDLAAYEDTVRRIFDDYELLYFIDKKDTVSEHPLIQFILSALLTVTYNFRYEHIFYHLKSVYYEEQDTIHRIENHCLRYGIKGARRWKAQWDEFDSEKTALIGKLKDFHEDMHASDTVRGKAMALYHYLEAVGVFEANQQIAADLIAENRLQEAEQYQKIYSVVMELMDELVAMIGSEEISVSNFASLMETGLTGIKLGQTPPSLDQILVGDISRSRFKENDAVFVLGVNEGKVPIVRSNNQLLTDRERITLAELGLEMAPDQSKSLFKEQMNIYMALSKPTRLLHLSYSRHGDEGSMRPATLFFTMMKMYPKVRVEKAEDIVSDQIRPTRLAPMFRRLTKLASDAGFEKHEDEISELYALFCHLKGKEKSAFNPDRFIDGLNYVNEAVGIGEMKNREYQLSVSQLEAYAGCPYAHYLDYRLKLNEREEYVVSLPDIGILFHRCLELYINKCAIRKLDISSMDANLRNRLVEECIREILADDRYRIFTSSYRNRYLVVKLTRILKRALWGIEEQLSKSKLRPKEIEYKFDGKEQPLKNLVLKISPNKSMFLKGVVDRVDEYETDDKLYISVIDYKSSNMNLDFGLIDSGVQLQLFVYLNVVQEIKEHATDKKVIPSGLYYYRIHDPMVQSETDEEEKLANALLKQLRPRGLVLHDEDIVRLFDESIAGTSNVIPVTMTKSGISKRSSTITREELEITQNYVKIMSRNLSKRLLRGDLGIDPIRYDQMTQCDYCGYRSICRFDPVNAGEGYHEVEKRSREEVIEKMKGDCHGRSH